MNIEEIQQTVIKNLKPDVVLEPSNLKLVAKIRANSVDYTRALNIIEIGILLSVDEVLVINISDKRHKNRIIKISIEYDDKITHYFTTAMYNDESKHFQAMVSGETIFTDFNFFKSIITFINDTEEQFFNLFQTINKEDNFTNRWSIE